MRPLNDTFLRALLREHCDYTPVWLMRQAGRYLAEYNETRAKAGSFLKLAQSPELACEVTLQPVDRFHLDAAILFSDILTVPDAMGLGLSFVAGEGPKFAKPVRHEEDVKLLTVPDIQKTLRYVTDAVSTIRKALNNRVPLIGFSGSPFTLACYMVEGGSSKDYRTIKTMMYTRPDLLHQILDINAEFSLTYIQKIIVGLHKTYDNERVPVIVFTKGGGQWLQAIASCGADAVGLDWTTNLSEARAKIQDKVALQGNLDPMVLFGSEEQIRQEVRRVIDDFGVVGNGGHVFNLGHGINQFTPPEAVAVLVDEVHRYSTSFHC